MKPARRRSLLALLLFLWSASFLSAAAAPNLSPVVQGEIDYLLNYIESCRCEFNRNGKWYQDTAAVREHVERKHNYFMEKGQIKSAEDFIKYSATKSEISGKPYEVRCAGESPAPLGDWLRHALERYRGTRK